MARKAEPGINFYPTKVNHTQNSKLRLLFNEHDANGYWIWSCLLGKIYEDKGYFFDTNNEDELELFATDICKKELTVVRAVIATCVRRGLFDKTLYESYGILTSDRIQMTYLDATAERRRKETKINFIKEFLLISEDSTWKNVIVTGKNPIVPRKNEIVPGNNPQSKVKKSIVKESKGNSSPSGSDEAEASSPDKSKYDLIDKNPKSVFAFIKKERPKIIQPYVDLWNYFADSKGKSKVTKISQTRKKKFIVRIHENEFDFIGLITKASNSKFLQEGSWFSFDWVIENDTNYLKVLEGKYDNALEKTEEKNGPTGQEISEEKARQIIGA